MCANTNSTNGGFYCLGVVVVCVWGGTVLSPTENCQLRK